jgi:general secretion pathway protein G
MKYRCPHCRNLFEEFEGSRCPSCGKGLRHPDRWKLLKPDKARREALQKRRAEPQNYRKPLLFVFVNRPRFTIWVLGGCILVVGFLLTVKMKPITPYSPPPKTAQTQKELVIIRTALEWFRSHCKRYPTTEEGLKALVRNPGVPDWKGYYLDQLPPDLWGNPYQYFALEDSVQLYSWGPDGKGGTPDDIVSPPPDYKALVKRLSLDSK